MEIPTINDFNRLENKLNKLVKMVKTIEPPTEKPPVILTREQLMKRLNITNVHAFYRRINKMVKYGMFKEGQIWMMFETDFYKYLESIRNESLKIQNNDN